MVWVCFVGLLGSAWFTLTVLGYVALFVDLCWLVGLIILWFWLFAGWFMLVYCLVLLMVVYCGYLPIWLSLG